MKAQEIFEKYNNKKVRPGGEIYINRDDSLDFIMKCEKFLIPIYRIEIVKLTHDKTQSSLNKIIDYDDQQDVYKSAANFIEDQVDEEWNYATFVVG